MSDGKLRKKTGLGLHKIRNTVAVRMSVLQRTLGHYMFHSGNTGRHGIQKREYDPVQTAERADGLLHTGQRGDLYTDTHTGSNRHEVISIERFSEIADEEVSLLPDEFFRELHGGVVISEEARLSPDDLNHDLYILGLYRRSMYGNMIILYYGSFVRTYPYIRSEDFWREKIREVVRHEFRHHLENLSGIHNSESLEAEDARALAQYRKKYMAKEQSEK